MPKMQADLLEAIPEYVRSWRRMSRFYALVSIVLNITLIFASAAVAAKLALKALFNDHSYEIFFGILSVLVAAGTSLNAWLKPREKWKGFMTDCENAEDIERRLNDIEDESADQIEKIRIEFQSLLANHREKNVF